MEKVKIPDSVTSLGLRVFFACNQLIDIEIGEANTAYQSIDGDLYDKNGETLLQYACGKSAMDVVILDGVTKIADGAFYNCDYIANICIPSTVTEIGEATFGDCNGLENVYITDLLAWLQIKFSSKASNPLSIAGNLYVNAELLTEIVIPETVTSIGDYAFTNAKHLTSVTLHDGITSVGIEAFGDALNVTTYGRCQYLGTADNPYYALIGAVAKGYNSYTIHENTKVIANGAFKNCTRVTKITVPSGVSVIGNEVFSDCTSLTEIALPENITSIGEKAFYGCSALTSFTTQPISSSWTH